jgi:hypothetical protein
MCPASSRSLVSGAQHCGPTSLCTGFAHARKLQLTDIFIF